MAILDNFDNVCTVGKRNEYSTKHVQTISLQSRVVGLESWTWTRVGLESGFWRTWTRWLRTRTWTWTLRD